MKLETDKIKIGQIVKKYRKIRGLTQFELAEKVGLNEKQVYRIEAGQNHPTYLNFVKLLEILDIDVQEFGCGEKCEFNPLKESIISIVNASSDRELKIYLDILKPLKKNLSIKNAPF